MEAMLAGVDDNDAAATNSDDDAPGGDGEMNDFAMLEAMLDD